MKIEGAAALVTGANRGLGAAIAQALLDAGATVYGGARDPASITNEDVIPVRLDVTNDDDIANAARRCGDVSIVVNNAGILRQSASLADGGVEAARAEMETNYFGSMRIARAFAPILRDNGGGALVNVLSVLSFISMPQGATYSASKVGRVVAHERAPHRAPTAGNPRRRGARRVHRHRHGRRRERGQGQPRVRREADRDRGRKPTPRRSSPMRPARWSKRHCRTISPRCIRHSRPSGTRKWRNKS